jgi:hypothetical protein
MQKRIIFKNGKKYIVNVPSWQGLGDIEQVGSGSLPIYFITPFIDRQPVDVSGSIGATISFSVSAGPAGPFDNLAYQWVSGSTNISDGAHFTGSQTMTLTVYNIIAANTGSYYVAVTNVNGTLTSSHVGLLV